ncbi:MAG: TerB N-terminal domain-containing protein [Clostridia bacterium]|nr:TerB N-terminal domain-containing protein [Clostridia bacterium]
MSGGSFDEKDDFWDIEKLIPKKKSTLRPFATKPVTTVYEPDSQKPSDAVSGEASDRRLTFQKSEEVENLPLADESYVPDGNRLIKRVTVKRTNDKYDFYGNFRKAALVYYDHKTEKCDYVPFFSYMPQYSQMNTEQKNYYFYWRWEIRRGRFVKTDYSYLYLYVYEILNLPDKIPASEGARILASLWREYKNDLPRIGANFAVWIQDYCLIHRIPCPTAELRGFMHEVIAASSFKEYYLADIKEADGESIGAMIAFLSDYDWRRGKFIEGSDTDAYKKHMYTAMRGLFLSLDECGELYDTSGGTRTLVRNAFPNSLCTHSVKCRIEIEYVSLMNADRLRAGITAAVRYTENKLRALMGIKSRLSVKDLPDSYRSLIDTYFDLISKREERVRVKADVPEYEKLYDAPDEKLSFAGADEIERASWQVTQRLVVEEEEETKEENARQKTEIRDEAPARVGFSDVEVPRSDGVDRYGLSDGDVAFLAALVNDDEQVEIDEFDAFSAAERINEAFSDAMGDVVLYNDGEKYGIYDDYTEEIKEWLKKITM